MKKITLCAVAILSSFGLIAQTVTFVNDDHLIGSYALNSEVAVDMNGDHLDDYVRIASGGVGIDYQNGDGTFTSQFYSMSISNPPSWSVAAGDMDGDGFTDLVLGNGNRVSFLWANSTDGINITSFTEDNSDSTYIFSQRSNVVDIDNDGDLDAFVCHDVDESHPYRNDGGRNMTLDQTFIVTLDRPGNYASVWVDYDNDGDTDMYLTKCRGGASAGDVNRDNAMYTNNGDGTFTENALDIGMRDNAQSWSTVFEDFDNDGDFDAFIVNHTNQNRFMLNDGNGNFTDIINTTGINANDLGAWENQTGDFNNDGYVDILSELSKELYLNQGDNTFIGYDMPFDEGGIADMNNDGFLDVVRNNDLWINQGNSNNYVMAKLIGVESNIQGIGARVKIYGDWGVQMREVRSGQGFSHMSSLNAHFGLGAAASIDKIVVEWPSGNVDELINPDINMLHVITEGDFPLNVTDFEVNGIQAFPNPAVERLNFSLNGLSDTKVQIVDINGRVILSTTIDSANGINVASLKSGVYFATFQVENQDVNYRFIKK
ncbi:MAG: FG-GAP-like repeat-containing protein [Gilvibacter sp.]